jgi:hypothetical protein
LKWAILDRSINRMRSGLTYLLLVIKTALRHSLHATHSIILALIIVAGFVTWMVPKVEVLVDLHGWRLAAAVLGGIIAVRLLLAPYWIWKNDQDRLAALSDELSNEAHNEQRLAARTASLDGLAGEIAWAENNSVNPKPHPASTADPETAIAGFEAKLLAWCDRVSQKLANRDVFTQGDQTHFDVLGFITPIQMWPHPKLNHLFSQLKLKIERLREIERAKRK